MASKPLPFAAPSGKPTPAIDFDDILAQSFGPLEALGSLARRLGGSCLGGSESGCAEDVLHLGFVIEALHHYGTMRFAELLTQAENGSTRQEVSHV